MLRLFILVILSGYTESLTGDCANYPCKNAGTCIQDGTDYHCNCTEEWTGNDCSQDFDECTDGCKRPGANCELKRGRPAWCGAHGSCDNYPAGTYNCLCRKGYEGKRCEIKDNLCLEREGLVFCKNGGKCQNKEGIILTCDCLPGFEGKQCETNIDECSVPSYPCNINTTVNCRDLINDYRCNCSPGFEGKNCSSATDECQSNPCNNGNCIDLHRNYTCECSEGFTGRNCEIKNACESDEWQYFNGHCYWTSLFQPTSKQALNWFGAERACRRIQADLVSIHSSSENELILTLNRCTPLWTGMVLLDQPSGSYGWIDGSEKVYQNWHQTSGNKSCVYINAGELRGVDGYWVGGECSTENHPFVCKKKAGQRLEQITHQSSNPFSKRGKCERNWVQQGEKCYLASHTKVDFFAALLLCQSADAHLATVHSSQEDMHLLRTVSGCDTPWIGLENTDPNLVGSNRGWHWNDNTSVNYSNWVNGSSPTNDHTRQCGRLARGTGWTNDYCWALHPFVCEKPTHTN